MESCACLSSLQVHPGSVQILVAVVKYKTHLQEPRKVLFSPCILAMNLHMIQGVCSSWLSSLNPGATVPVWTVCGSFSFPLNTPLIMVGPGTGCAPFRALLEEKRYQPEAGEGSSVASLTLIFFKSLSSANMLFFGCRSSRADNFFAEEWGEMVAEGMLVLFSAFSRDQPHKVLTCAM